MTQEIKGPWVVTEVYNTEPMNRDQFQAGTTVPITLL